MNLSIMAPNHHFLLNGLPLEPVSRTYQYRKIMKPMLERKRRARINKCLDELKDLMTGTMPTDGENVSKLEKADILELTVRHLHRLREQNALFFTRSGLMNSCNFNRTANNNNNNALDIEKFWAGYQHCAVEVSQFLNKYDRKISCELIKHISGYMPHPKPSAAATTTTSAAAVASPVTTAATNYELRRRDTGTRPIRVHLHCKEGQSKVKLEPYARQRHESDGVWRPW